MNANGETIFVAAATRRLAVRLRPDLEIVRERLDGHTWWMVKDPVAERYFRFREEEAAVMELLDGQTSLADIRARFQQRFTPRTISEAQIHAFVGALHQSGLVLTDRAGQGQQLLDRHMAQRRRQRLAALTNVLAIRFRGFDPDGLLDWLYPGIRWMFTRGFAAVAIGLVVAALLLVAINFDRFWTRLPALDEFFQARSLLWMAVALGFSKVLHELGHAFTCKHYG
ncbi:MAG: hemolysin D, partial [Pirellulales bacterium]